MQKKETLRICEKGHHYYKSCDCPVCPICETEKKPQNGLLSVLSAPARRALENNGITTLEQLSRYSEKELLQFHGFGKSSIPKLRAMLEKENLIFNLEKQKIDMKRSSQAESILAQINTDTKLGDLRKIASAIKKDHELALELWSTAQFLPRQLAILIMDKKQLSQKLIDNLDNDIQQHSEVERLQLIDWLMANQLSKDKKTISLMETWENSQSSLQRRVFWYYQARLRWVGQTPPPNSEELLSKIETRIEKEVPEVQWAMNYTTAQIGIFEKKYRSRCVALGERTGLYKDEIVAKNCTPNYLPKFIAIQVDKLKK